MKGMFATRHGNTCPHSLPIAHQTHRPVDGCKPGWRLGCLNSIRSATQTIADSSLLASVRATKTGPPFPDHFSAHKRTAVTTSTPQGCIFPFIYLLLCGVQKCCDNNFFCCFYRLNFFHWMTECSPCNFPLPPSFPRVLALRQICLCAILITAKAIFMVVFCENTNLQKR